MVPGEGFQAPKLKKADRTLVAFLFKDIRKVTLVLRSDQLRGTSEHQIRGIDQAGPSPKFVKALLTTPLGPDIGPVELIEGIDRDVYNVSGYGRVRLHQKNPPLSIV